MMNRIRYKSPFSGLIVEVAPELVLHRSPFEYLPPEVSTGFVMAAEAGGVNFKPWLKKIERANQRSDPPLWWATGPQPWATIEPWHCEQPWPIFVGAGHDVLDEFYPEEFK